MQEQQMYNENFLKNQDLVNRLVMTFDEDGRIDNSREVQKLIKKI